MNEGCLRIGFSSFFDGFLKELIFLLLLGESFKGIRVADTVFLGGSFFVSSILLIVDENIFGESSIFISRTGFLVDEKIGGKTTSRVGLFGWSKGESFGRRKSGGREKVGTLILSLVVS